MFSFGLMVNAPNIEVSKTVGNDFCPLQEGFIEATLLLRLTLSRFGHSEKLHLVHPRLLFREISKIL